jgi:hypothetical protein
MVMEYVNSYPYQFLTIPVHPVHVEDECPVVAVLMVLVSLSNQGYNQVLVVVYA